ncbi:MAG: DegT/DnrJ/EryC1/StrS family aminotransferase [Thermoplasmata archaeon]
MGRESIWRCEVLIPIARPFLSDEEVEAVTEVLRSGILARGPKVKEFEERFAECIGRKHAIATSSGTSALHISNLLMGVSENSEVIIPPITFFATASTVLFCGGRPVFADVDPETYTLDPKSVKRRVTSRTRAILPVDLYGQTADYDAIQRIADKNDLKIVEDACQAHGAAFNGKMAGSFGDISSFSFYATKNITTGEGGIVLTDDDQIAERARLLREHGEETHYNHVLLGYNYRMMEISAAIGIVQLRKMDEIVRRRQENARMLTEELENVKGLETPITGKGRVHSFYQYIIRVNKESPVSREKLMEHLQKKGVGSRPSYPIPLYEQPVLKNLRIAGQCPEAERLLPQLLELPVHPHVVADDIQLIGKSIRECLRP